MEKTRYINWTVTQADSLVNPLSYTVEFVDDKVSYSPSLLRRSSNNFGEFEYDPLGNDTWVPFPAAGIDDPEAGIKVRFGFTPSGCSPAVIFRGGFFYQIATDDAGIASFKEYPDVSVSKIHVDRENGDLLIFSASDGVARSFDPSLNPRKYIAMDDAVLDVVPDSARKSLWYIGSASVSVRNYAGEVIFSHDMPNPITSVRDMLVCRNTGDMIMSVYCSGTPFLIHINRAYGIISNINADYCCLGRWGARSVLAGTGAGGQIYSYNPDSGLVLFNDLSGLGIRTDSLMSDVDEDYYVLDNQGLTINKISLMSGTVTWSSPLTSSSDNSMYDFDVSHDSGFPRPLVTWSEEVVSTMLDLGSTVTMTGQYFVSGNGETVGTLMSGYAPRQSMVRISSQ
jgi:hypothetical protein